MGQFFIDDSVHDEAGFVLGACIYTESDISSEVKNIIGSHGFDPDQVEYKSSANYSKNPEMGKVRSALKDLLHSCKLGVVIVPREFREQLGIECLKGLKQFIDHNENISRPLDIYFDQGMFGSVNNAQSATKVLGFSECSFFFEQDSLKVPGIQMADLAAHTASMQLKDAMGLIHKKVMINDGGYEGIEIELGFEMWATLRYCFFKKQTREILENEDIITRATLDAEPYGVYVSPLCGEKLREIARGRFSKVYVGCIH